MRKLDMEKVGKLSTANDMLDEKYGKFGTESRAEFDAKALAWYYGNLICDRRQELKLAQRDGVYLVIIQNKDDNILIYNISYLP